MEPDKTAHLFNRWQVQSRLFEPVSDIFPALEAHSVQLAPGSFRVEATVGHVRDVWLSRIDVSTSKSITHNIIAPSVLSFLVPMSWEEEYRVNGQFVTPTTIFLNSGPDGYSALGAKRTFVNVGLMRDPFTSTLAALLGLSPEEVRLHDGAMTLAPDVVGRLRHTLNDCLMRVTGTTALSPRARNQMAEAVYNLMVDTYLAAVARPKQKRSRATSPERIVRRVEEHFAEFCEERISLADLCAAAGVGQTVLYEVFHDIYGIPPLAYLKNRRLMKARSRLIRHEQDAVQVKEIALSQGLTHLGRFSRDYRSLFGESPSTTLSSSKNSGP